GRIKRNQADFQGEFPAILAKALQLKTDRPTLPPGRTSGSPALLPTIFSKELWQQSFNGLAQEFIQAVGEKFFRLRVHENNPACRIKYHDARRSRVQHCPG